MNLKVVANTPKLIRVALSGTFESSTQAAWDSQLVELASKMGQDVIVDLTDVHRMVSVDFGALLNAARIVERKSAKFILLKPKPAVAAIIETLGFKHVLKVAKDEAEAQAMLSQ